MNKTIKRILSFLLVVAAFATVEPANYINLITEKAYASSSDDDDVYLDDITISGEDLSFSSDESSYNLEVAETTNQIRIKAEPEDNDDTVEIDGTTVDEDDNYKRWVSLDKGKNVIKVKVEDDDDNDRTYTLNVYRGEKASSETVGVGKVDNSQDSIYLDELGVVTDKYNLIDFNHKVTSYEVNVNEDYDNIIVKAEPDDSGDNVRVNDGEVDSNYNKRVDLEKGKNVIKVKVYNDENSDDDDYEQRIYTIIVNRGTTTTTTTDTALGNNTNNSGTISNNSASNTTVKANQWVKNNYGQWTYNDALGKPMINTWFFDKNYGKWYRFGLDGSMRTGWQYENGNSYYLNEDGSMQIGWKYIGNLWYCFNNNGSTKTGWYQDNDGKWYYFYPGGVMASNIRISGYTLGTDGAMI